MAYIGYETPEEAIRAFGELDNKIMLVNKLLLFYLTKYLKGRYYTS
jgi:hypothetical protein